MGKGYIWSKTVIETSYAHAWNNNLFFGIDISHLVYFASLRVEGRLKLNYTGFIIMTLHVCHGVSNGNSTVCSRTCSGPKPKKKHKTPHYCSFVKGIQRWPMGSNYKWPVMRKGFPWLDVIMHCANHKRWALARAEFMRMFMRRIQTRLWAIRMQLRARFVSACTY